MSTLFPFTAVVGQERMKRALVLNAVNPGIGGVLIRGERGTAKSTAARALAALLPEVSVVAGCRFKCDPDAFSQLCTECLIRLDREGELPLESKPISFVDLPVSATEDRVVGTLDIEKAIKAGERRFEPGILAAANRGLLYIDEVNLLDDHVVNVLLDAAAMGVNIVEREGISFFHPARFILVGTMNPEEGDLRPQLLDRFALAVDVRGVEDRDERKKIIQHNISFEENPEFFYEAWRAQEEQQAADIVRARDLFPAVTYTDGDLDAITALTSAWHVDGHRADLAILRTARTHTALMGREAITVDDIALAAELALAHRIKSDPFDPVEISLEEIEAALASVLPESAVSNRRGTGKKTAVKKKPA